MIANVRLSKRHIALALAASNVCSAPAAAQPPTAPKPKQVDDGVRLSWFGERPAFSPDGKRLAFVDRLYGNAFELDLATKKVRNLTAHTAHHGIVRIHYLANGDFVMTAPRTPAKGPASTSDAQVWHLDKGAERGLVLLEGPRVFEGLAVSRTANLVAYATPIGRPTRAGEAPPMGFFVAEVAYADGVPAFRNARRIDPKQACPGEAQDFRDRDRELVISCYILAEPGTGYWSGVYGLDLASGALKPYRTPAAEYNEAEGTAPDGTWTAVECAPRAKEKVGALDICRLELKPDGRMSVLLAGAAPGSTRKVNNPVISPDGRWMAFATSDTRYELGSGDGIMMVDLTR